MPVPICVACGLSMRCHRNGQPVIVTSDKEKEQPYKLYFTDVYKCPDCGIKIVTGFSKPIERHEDRFQAELDGASRGEHWILTAF